MNDTNIWAKEPPLIMSDHPYGVPHNERAEQLNGRLAMLGCRGCSGRLRADWSNHPWYLVMAKSGLYANIHAKRLRIKQGSDEKMRKPGSAGAPTAKQFKQAAKTAKKK
jgi:hypothetical protein